MSDCESPEPRTYEIRYEVSYFCTAVILLDSAYVDDDFSDEDRIESALTDLVTDWSHDFEDRGEVEIYSYKEVKE